MKASMTLTIVLCSTITLTTTNAQNYQTVQSNETHFFIDQTHSYFLASKVENIEIEGSDSIFYTFQTVREDENVADGEPCKYYLGPAWTGPKTIIKPNGQNIFFNSDNEPIVIETQAALNDTFQLYTYGTGEWINGVVSNIVPVSIFGVMDSVKIIDLFSNAPLTLDNPRIMLSQNHGFVEQFAFYSFPFPYEGAASITGENDFPAGYSGNFELVGIDTSGFSPPTTLDIHDHDIGDVYKYFSSQVQLDGSYRETYRERKIINRFQWGTDSIMYFVEEGSQTTFYPSNGDTYTIVQEPELSSETFFNLAEPNNAYLPEQFNGSDGWSTLRINSCGDVEETVKKEAMYYDGILGCLQVEEYGSNISFTAIKGAGWLNQNGEDGTGQTFHSELVYYNLADGSECGTNQFLTTEQNDEMASFNMYPNPTNGELFIELNKISPTTIITVVDNSGRVIRIWKDQMDPEIMLDMTSFNAGVYTVLVENDNEIMQERVIKQ